MKISKEVKVGLFATTALIIIYLGCNFLKGNAVFSSNNIYCTTYAKTGGLSTASPVLVNGMPVGRVKRIQVLTDQGHSALVTFETAKNITLTDATKANLVSRNLLGEKAIDLIIEAGNPLKNYDSVPGKIEEGLSEAFVASVLPTLNDAKDISLLTSRFVASLVENTDKISNTFDNLEGVTAELKQIVRANRKGITSVSQNLEELSRLLADSKNGIGPLLTKLNKLMEGLEGQEAKVVATKLCNILDSLETVLAKTGKGENSLGRLLDDDTLYTNVNQTLGDLDQLLVDFRKQPWRYVNFSIFGRKSRLKTKKKE